MTAGVAQTTPEASCVPVARTDNTIDPGWLTLGTKTRHINLFLDSAKSLTGSPALDTSETNKRYLFDASATEAVTWQFLLPSNFSDTPVVKLVYSMVSATSGDILVAVDVMAVSPGDAADVNTPSFDTTNTQLVTVPASAGYIESITVTLDNADTMAAGDYVKLKFSRVAADVTDTATGDMELLSIVFEYQSGE